MTENGKKYRRNRRQLLLTKELFKRQNDYDIDDDLYIPDIHDNANQVNNAPLQNQNIRRSDRQRRRPDRLIEQD